MYKFFLELQIWAGSRSRSKIVKLAIDPQTAAVQPRAGCACGAAHVDDIAHAHHCSKLIISKDLRTCNHACNKFFGGACTGGGPGAAPPHVVVVIISGCFGASALAPAPLLYQ
jgi:hypothetical protein